MSVIIEYEVHYANEFTPIRFKGRFESLAEFGNRVYIGSGFFPGMKSRRIVAVHPEDPQT